MGYAVKNPSWWSDKHTSSWERVKDAFHRDWEQTKHDFSKEKGQALKQNAGDTVKQAAGKESIPPEGTPNMKPMKDSKSKDFGYESHEPALRYGFGASSQYSQFDGWNDQLERTLKDEWTGLGTDRDWTIARDDVRAGFERGRKHS